MLGEARESGEKEASQNPLVFLLQMDIQAPHNPTSIIFIDHRDKTEFIIGLAIPSSENFKDKDIE